MKKQPYILTHDITLVDHIHDDLVAKNIKVNDVLLGKDPVDEIDSAPWVTLSYPNGETIEARIGMVAPHGDTLQPEAFVQFRADDAFTEKELLRWLSKTGGRYIRPEDNSEKWIHRVDGRSREEDTEEVLFIIDTILKQTV